MISAPLVEKALFNKFYLDWKTPAGLSRAARRHIIVALALVIQIVGSLVGMITASTAAGIIIGKQSGLGPIVSPAGGAVLAIFLGAVSNVNANTMLRRQGIPPADTYDVDEDALDGVMDCVAIQVQFAISGAVGLIGVLVGAVVAWVEYKEDSVAKSSWLVHTYIPVVGDFYIPANALLQFNLQMYQAPKAFLLVKADFARRHTLLHRHA
ncbi:hypothetical protein FRB96_009037 [Tulasnella sp. 330]|nr:hypothetical protein FRB96_009037 [Tulasnella sp. 330]